MSATPLPALIQRFFIGRLQTQLGASRHTIAGYRDTFRLLLGYVSQHRQQPPSQLTLEDLEAELLCSFLDHLEHQRGNAIRTRNCRLAALHAFFHFVSYEVPHCLLQCQQVLAIPTKRYAKRTVEFLNEQETAALVAAPELSTWIGRRDRALLLLAVQTGLRSQELRALCARDVELNASAFVRCLGKGRKQRNTPLRTDVVVILRDWLAEQSPLADQPVFPSLRGHCLSADALQRIVHRHVCSASTICASLRERRITPHTLRHTAAMALLQHGVDLAVIALWLGHESIETTHQYLHADMRIKERALSCTDPAETRPSRFKPDDSLLAFLKGL
jgi:site-specific recombinase XerD